MPPECTDHARFFHAEPQPGAVFTVGIAGSGRFTEEASQRVDAFFQFHAFAYDYPAIRLIVGCDTAFDRQTLLRIAALKSIFPMITITLIVVRKRHEGLGKARKVRRNGLLNAYIELADEVVIVEEQKSQCEILANRCDLILEGYGNGRESMQELLHKLGGKKVCGLFGPESERIWRLMSGIAYHNGLVPPGRLAEDRRPLRG